MSAGALAGFTLAFVVTLVTLSSLGALVLAACRSQVARIGANAERRLAEAVAVVPVVIAVVVVGTLAAQSTLGVDHCEVHAHHAHLCFTHGAPWIERTWVVVTLAVAIATFVARTAIVAVTYVRGLASVRTLRAASHCRDGIHIVESDRAFCFVARGGLFVSSRVWASLPSRERDAVIAHEQAHLRHGDLAKRFALELFLLFAAPFASDIVRPLWLRASERMCDAHAADVTDPQTVASAMVSMCKLGSLPPVASFAFTPTARELAVRIQAVLTGGLLGEQAARRIARATAVACVAFAIACATAAEPLHHAFETLLG